MRQKGIIAAILFFGLGVELVAGDAVLRRWDFTSGPDGWIAAHDVSNMAASDGVLQLTTTGTDAYIMVDPGRLPTASLHLLRVRMRSDRPGRAQVYFTTTDAPDPAANAIPSFSMAGDNRWNMYEVRMLGQEGWHGALTMLRLDPVNPARDARVEIDWIELVSLAPVLRIESFAPDRTFVAPSGSFQQRVVVRNVGGPLSGPAPFVELAAEGASILNPTRVALQSLENGGVGAATWTLSAGTGAWCRLSARIVSATGETFSTVRSSIPLATALVDGETPQLHDGRIGISVRDGIEMRVFARTGGSWQLAALARPLARLAVGEPMEMEDVRFTDVAREDNGLVLHATATSRALGVALRFWLDETFVHCRAQLEAGGQNVALLHFSGPTLLVPGVHKRGGLFPGVEYLNADEPSSRSDIIGRRFANRSVPPAFWITAPVMAVESDAALVALLWNPAREWAPGHAAPAAVYASPNFLDGQDNHLLQLFVPGVGDGTEPSERLARRGLSLGGLRCVSLESAILVRADAHDVVEAVETWARLQGLPEAPTPPHDATRTEEICTTAFRDTLYEPGEGWTMHWGMGERPWRNLDFIQRLVSYAHRTGDAQWLEHTDVLPATHLLDVLGPLESAFGPPPREMATQRADGTWVYEETEETRQRTRKVSRGEADTLGRAGSTNVGVCAVRALPVIEYALRWGEPAAVDAASRALSAMLAFRVPAGAQTWEVHKDIPDINAAGAACECFRMGYELFGDRRYLDAAVYWARTGLPFVYLWNAPSSPEPATVVFNGIRGKKVDTFVKTAGECYENPDRRVLPFATIPVFGSTFYVVQWYGHPVQWCGLVWAEAVLELCTLHGSEIDPASARLLRQVAEGVLVSARWQQLDKPPYTGLLPDSWHPESNQFSPAMIAPIRIHDCLLLASGVSDGRALHTRVLRMGARRVHLTTRAELGNVEVNDAVLTFQLRYLKDEPFDCLVVHAPRVSTIRVDGARLEPLPQDTRPPGYTLHEDRQHLELRLVGTGGWQRVEVP